MSSCNEKFNCIKHTILLIAVTITVYFYSEVFRILNNKTSIDHSCGYSNIHVYLLSSSLVYLFIIIMNFNCIYNNFRWALKIYIVTYILNVALTIWGYLELYYLVCPNTTETELITFSNGVLIFQTIITSICTIFHVIYGVVKLIDFYTVSKYRKSREIEKSSKNITINVE